jgi:hypothetical protein
VTGRALRWLQLQKKGLIVEKNVKVIREIENKKKES